MSTNTLTVEGDFQGQEVRTYYLYEPTARESAAPPLLITMHGGGGNANTFANNNGLLQAAEDRGWVVLAPQGLSQSWRHTDDPDHITDNATADAGDDMQFFADLWAEVIPHLGVDPDRIFITGVSAGGMMAYRLAGERPGGLPIRAMGQVSATLTIDPSLAAQAAGVDLLHLHGGADTNVPIAGGGSNPTADYPPIAVGIDHWRTENDCGDGVVVTAGLTTTTTYTGTDGVRVITKIKSDGTHGWDNAVPSCTDEVMAFFDSLA